MIATTKRGVLVTRFGGIGAPLDLSVTLTGYTVGGLWLIENGKVTKPLRNFRFTESPFIALNKVEQIGATKRVFHPRAGLLPPGYAPVAVPALKIRDFNFSSLAESL
jgi:predicted Zn-dependent protease